MSDTTGPGDTYRVAAVQFEPRLGAKAENIARLLALVETAARNSARLIVLPEMATTGYCWHDRDEVRPFVEPIPGPTTDAFSELAGRYDCYIVIGMPEVAPHSGIFYNSAALVGPGGLLGVYRKTHSYVSELKWAKDGDLGLPVWDTPLGRLGVLICMDAGYFEPARLLALAGADVLCFPTNWLGEKSPGAAWRARAFENGCYLIGANRYGLERGVQFSGGSCVLDPDGTVQAMQDTGDGIVYGEVSLAAARAKSFGETGPPEKLAARRPALYENLTLNSYLWDPMELHGLYGHRPLPSGRRSRVAVGQFAPSSGDPAANIGRIESLLAALRASDGGEPVELAVFPEYALTGSPGRGRENVALAADDVCSWHERLVALARRAALHLAVGYAERRGEQVFSAIALAGPDGVVACYHKTHVVGEERAWCAPGAIRPPVVDLPLGRVGLLVGADLCFPELPRSLAIAGCDLLVVAGGAEIPPVQAAGATAVPLPPPAIIAADPSHFHLARQRAVENDSYLAFASAPAPHGIGCSAVFGPDRDGEVVLPAGESGIAAGTVDTAHIDAPYPGVAAVRSKMLLGMRQPHLYDALQIDQRAR
jgi:predicted amidohydrolase